MNTKIEVGEGLETRRRIYWRLLPFLFTVYITAYLDRSNISFASLKMTQELHFSPQVFGFGAGIFFLGYALLDIPCTVLIELWSARKVLSTIMIFWGVIALGTGFIHTAHEFYTMRFLLGLAEAGFFPGVIVYLFHWFRKEDRGKAAAVFMAAIPVSQVICGPISAALLNVHWLGYSGWRWMLSLEGVPGIFFGVATFFYLTDKPRNAAWLSGAEQAWIEGELRREHEQKRSAEIERVEGKFKSTLEALRSRDVIVMILALFFFQGVNYGVILWLPKIVQFSSGKGVAETSLLATLPFLAGLAAMIFAGWYSDRKRERRMHAAAYTAIACGALAASQIPRLPWEASLAMLSVAIAGLYGFNPIFYLLPSEIFSGTAAAASVGFLNSCGHLGGFVGPEVMGYLVVRTGSYRAGVFFLSACALASSILILALRDPRRPLLRGESN